MTPLRRPRLAACSAVVLAAVGGDGRGGGVSTNHVCEDKRLVSSRMGPLRHLSAVHGEYVRTWAPSLERVSGLMMKGG
jgi:hypothetical protein